MFEWQGLFCYLFLQILKQNNTRLENRTQLVTMCHMGPKVFINCAGFIKIDTASLGDRWVLDWIQCRTGYGVSMSDRLKQSCSVESKFPGVLCGPSDHWPSSDIAGY